MDVAKLMSDNTFDPLNVEIVLNPSVDFSHKCTLPLNPATVKEVAFVPAQSTEGAPVTVPPTEMPFTVIVNELEVTSGQTPLATIALYPVVVARFNSVNRFEPETEVNETNPSVDFCQNKTFPLNPVNVKFVELAPSQTVDGEPETDPPIEMPFTVIVNDVEVVAGQTPLDTIALKLVDVVRVAVVNTLDPDKVVMVLKLFEEDSQ